MQFTTPLAILALLTTTALAAPTSNPNTSPLLTRDGPVKLALYDDAICHQPHPLTISFEANTCYDIHMAKGLKVLSWDNGTVRYDSLRVFKTKDCSGGWELQPLVTECSDISVYGTIMVAVGQE